MKGGRRVIGARAPDLAWQGGRAKLAGIDPAAIARRLSWDDIRIISTLSECGGRAAAAARLGINVSTVSRRLAGLEQALGVTLFDRRHAGYVLTAEGSALRALGERMELDVVSVARQLSPVSQAPLGTLRITTSDSLLLYFLTPILADFKVRHAAIDVEVLVGNHRLNLARDESDIALRATCSPRDSLVGRKLATIAWAAYGCARHFSCRIPDAGQVYERQWVSYTAGLGALKATQYLDARAAPHRISYRTDSVAALSAAVAVGLGLGFLPCMLGDITPGLTRVGPVVPELDDELWLLTHPDIRKTRRVRAFMDFCCDEVARRKALIEGRQMSQACFLPRADG